MQFDFMPADQVDAAGLHRAFGAAFSDYLLGALQLTLAQWPQFLARQCVDLGASRVATAGPDILAFAFVAPRPQLASWRLATMGAVPAARGSGAAAALLDNFVDRARRAGMRQVELECFVQNERALRLYRGRGFEGLHPLHGYARAAGAALAPVGPRAAAGVALESAYAWLEQVSRERGDLPLQVTAPTLRALSVPPQAWRLGSAQVVFSEAPDGTVTLHSLVDTDPAQRAAESLVGQLLQAHAGRRFAVPQLQRPDLGGEALQRLGFERLPLHQLMMRRAL